MKTKTMMRIADAALIALIVICFADAVLTYAALTHLDNVEEANPIIKDIVNANPISAIIYQIFPVSIILASRYFMPRIFTGKERTVALLFLVAPLPAAVFRSAVLGLDIMTVLGALR